MNKTNWLIIGMFSMLLLMPLVTTNNYYPIQVGDFKTDVARAEQAKIDKPINDVSNHYLGRSIAAYIVGKTSLITKLDTTTLQLVFDYTILVAACIVIYLITKGLFGIVAGVLSSGLTFLGIPSLLELFNAGDIWNIIEVCLLLIPAIYFLAKWLTNRKRIYLVITLILLALFSSVHPLALILPYVLGVFFGSIIIYKAVKKEYKELIKFVTLLVCIIAGNLLLSSIFIKDAIEMHIATIFRTTPPEIQSNPIIEYGSRTPVNFISLIFNYITFPILGIAILLLSIFGKSGFQIQLSTENKWFLAIMITFIAAFGLAAISTTSIDPNRHARDLATFIAITIGCCAGIIITKYRKVILNIAIYGISSVGMLFTLLAWNGVTGR